MSMPATIRLKVSGVTFTEIFTRYAEELHAFMGPQLKQACSLDVEVDIQARTIDVSGPGGVSSCVGGWDALFFVRYKPGGTA